MVVRGAAAWAARLLVASSIPGAALFIASAARGDYLLHARLAALYVLPVFVTGIAVAYLASAVKSLGVAAAAASLPVLPAALCSLTGCTVLASPALAFASAPFLYGASRTRGSVSLSLYGLGIAYVSSSLAAAVGLEGLRQMLAMVYALPVGAIYAVTVHSFPRTYRLEPRYMTALTAYSLNAAGALLLALGHLLAAPLLLAGLAAYLPAARLEKVPQLLPRTWRERSKGPATRSHWYFIAGHAAALAAAALAAAGLLLYHTRGDLVAAIHGATAGFVLTHIEIHAPMMVPVLFGIRHARRYNVIPYMLSLTAAILVASHACRAAALVLAAAALAATTYVAWPPPRRSTPR